MSGRYDNCLKGKRKSEMRQLRSSGEREREKDGDVMSMVLSVTQVLPRPSQPDLQLHVKWGKKELPLVQYYTSFHLLSLLFLLFTWQRARLN